MPEHAYRLVNVFAQGNDAFSGNPLCVFENGDALDVRTMQALARQFNLSETTFIMLSRTASARVRIFTPSYEMPFAGHPTLGTAYVCRALGLASDELSLEMQAGVIPVHARGRRWTLQANAPKWREVSETRADVAEMLGIRASDIIDRPLWVSAGREQLIVPLASAAAVQSARPRGALLEQMKSEDGASMAYVFAPAEPAVAPAGNGTTNAQRLVARFFFPQGPAVLEDPATGSATANLGGWCRAMQRSLPCRFEIAQGAQAGRPSTLYLEVDARGRILVSGEVLELGRGTIML